MTQKRTDWHPEDIRAEIRKRFGSMAALGRHFGVSKTAVPNTINQPGYSAKMEQRLAEILGLKACEIWPSRYHRDGSPVSFRAERSVAARQNADLHKKSTAA
ncbi:helix-turn-helix domain-containing protein [Bombella apis]|uniref:helix-turn-helix domain-containing protein n=2 Tax=Bombella apis TaxID=1785988 RepID=UPI0012B8189A|nr:helix-turn-helix domain-containing protein [Bombella apis]MPW00102.1 transcriptional regulator [Bombella apis]